MAETQTPEPDVVRIQQSASDGWQDLGAASSITVELRAVGRALRVDVGSTHEVSRVLLRWRRAFDPESLVLGDAWERSYGDLEWRALRAERPLPWTVLVHHRLSGATWGFGVEVRGGAFAFWQVDQNGLTLVLDVRSGGVAVRPGTRMIHAATVHAVDDEEDPFTTQQVLARLQCPDPIPPIGPIVGANNWYYAYGRNFDQNAVVRDARTLAELIGEHPVRPFGVIDDGWSVGGTAGGRAASGGPWDTGRAHTFPNLADAADAIRAEGVRPGIWFRPLLRRDDDTAGILGPRDGGFALDPSSPSVLDLVEEDVRRFSEWGFELLKHDFSTYDLLGRWGPEMGPSPASPGWTLSNPGVTTAEALVGLYRRFKEAAGRAAVLSCNVVGHLAAGLVDAHRIGDDTSGIEWDRTRRVGVNTLAFRIAQHRSFFAVDADCVPSTAATDWSKNRQFLDLVARSGTVLFVSVDPRTRSDAVDSDLATALRCALDGGEKGFRPADWLNTPTPENWTGENGDRHYSWLEPSGADALEPVRTGAGL